MIYLNNTNYNIHIFSGQMITIFGLSLLFGIMTVVIIDD